MTNKEIAKKLRYVAEYNLSNTHLIDLADELDPPRPGPGTVVWWRFRGPEITGEWENGVVGLSHNGVWTSDGLVKWERILWKAAHILAPDEVAVKVPSMSEWPRNAEEADLRWHYGIGTMSNYANVTITRAEAERMEAEQ